MKSSPLPTPYFHCWFCKQKSSKTFFKVIKNSYRLVLVLSAISCWKSLASKQTPRTLPHCQERRLSAWNICLLFRDGGLRQHQYRPCVVLVWDSAHGSTLHNDINRFDQDYLNAKQPACIECKVVSKTASKFNLRANGKVVFSVESSLFQWIISLGRRPTLRLKILLTFLSDRPRMPKITLPTNSVKRLLNFESWDVLAIIWALHQNCIWFSDPPLHSILVPSGALFLSPYSWCKQRQLKKRRAHAVTKYCWLFPFSTKESWTVWRQIPVRPSPARRLLVDLMCFLFIHTRTLFLCLEIYREINCFNNESVPWGNVEAQCCLRGCKDQLFDKLPSNELVFNPTLMQRNRNGGKQALTTEMENNSLGLLVVLAARN